MFGRNKAKEISKAIEKKESSQELQMLAAYIYEAFLVNTSPDKSWNDFKENIPVVSRLSLRRRLTMQVKKLIPRGLGRKAVAGLVSLTTIFSVLGVAAGMSKPGDALYPYKKMAQKTIGVQNSTEHQSETKETAKDKVELKVNDLSESDGEISKPDEDKDQVSEPSESDGEVSNPEEDHSSESDGEISKPDEDKEEVSDHSENNEEVTSPDEDKGQVSDPSESDGEVSKPSEDQGQITEPSDEQDH